MDQHAGWACEYKERPHRPVEYLVSASMIGTRPRDGEELTDADRSWTSKRFQPTGAIDSVKISFHTSDAKAAQQRVDSLMQQVSSWGCARVSNAIFECGTWTATVAKDDTAAVFVARAIP